MSFDLDLNFTVKSTFCFASVHIVKSAIPICRGDTSVSTLVASIATEDQKSAGVK